MRLFDFKKYDSGIFYREVVLETNKNIGLQLADIPLPNGILRIDRNVSTEKVEWRLGHYALPMVSGAIKEQRRKIRGHEVRIIDNGVYQLAMVVLNGPDDLEVVAANGLNPVSRESKVINLSGKFEPGHDDLCVVLMLWKRSGRQWTDNELIPVSRILRSGTGNKITIVLSNGEKKIVHFE